MQDFQGVVFSSRRSFLRLSTGLSLLGLGGLLLGPAAPAAGAWRRLSVAEDLVGDEPVTSDGISLDLPLVSEDGSVVPLGISIDSPMTDDDYVEAIHLFAPRNPNPEIAVFRLTPLAGRAELATRIRLNETQQVIVLARTHRGQWHAAVQEVRVTVSGCLIGADAGTDESHMQPRVRVPGRLASGESGEVLTMISHPMETGFREGADGSILARHIIHGFTATFGGQRVLEAELHPSLSANPYLRFHIAPKDSGELLMEWVEDGGNTARATAEIEVG